LQWNNGRLQDVFQASDTVGSNDEPDTATPEGRVTVADKRWDPIWTPPKSIDPTQTPIGPYSQDQSDPLGVAFIRLEGSILHGGAYGLHGTNNPLSIGYSISHGCIRHHNEDIAVIMGLVEHGTPVYIMSNFEGTTILSSDLNKMK
jgi:lipoprotein-anchoring transpeptidase ErfK/SrfK